MKIVSMLVKTFAALIVLAPLVPLNAQAVSGKLTLTWTDNSSNETGFEVERAEVVLPPATPVFARIATLSSNVVTYEDLAVTVGKSYMYRVRAVNSAGVSGYSNTVVSPPVPAPLPKDPTDLKATAVQEKL